MSSAINGSRRIRFGPFEADLCAGELRKYGVRVRIQDQPFKILTALVESPGVPVSRETLRQRLWPKDTFVDFEHGLNAAVTRLRQALGDSAENPRYIETVAKRGYRFIGEIEIPVPSAEPPEHRLRAGSRIYRLLAIAAVFLGGCAAVFFAGNPRVEEPPIPVPLSSFPGSEVDPALSPDGEQVAFAWNGAGEDNYDIYVMGLEGNSPRQLTSDPHEDLSPAWSPDGKSLAFVRRLRSDYGELIVMPSGGGPEHKVAQLYDLELRVSGGRLVGLAWSPDGAWIAAAQRETPGSGERLHLYSLTGQSRRLVHGQSPFGDHMPAWSPDGRHVAFCRMAAFSASDIYVQRLDAGFHPVGAPWRIAGGKAWSTNPLWLTAERILYVSASVDGGHAQFQEAPASPGRTSKPVSVHSSGAYDIALNRHLVYSSRRKDTDIWRATIPPLGSPPASAQRFISSTFQDQMPRYSRDGRRIAFVSDRSGTTQIWVSDADGGNPVRLTNFQGTGIGVPDWSPDGQWIVYHARPEGQADLFITPAAGGPARRLDTHPDDDTLPVYSSDGQWIYFASMRSGTIRIWRMPAAGGAPSPVTDAISHSAAISPDGSTVFYDPGDGAEIHRVSVSGGAPTRIGGKRHVWPSGYVVTAEGLYYAAPPHSGAFRHIRFLNFKSGRDRPVATAMHPFGLGMSVSPDGEYILFDQTERRSSDLMVIKDFTSRHKKWPGF